MMPMMAACMFDAMKDIKSWWSIAKGQSNILRRTLHVETPQSLITYRFRMQVWNGLDTVSHGTGRGWSDIRCEGLGKKAVQY